jgi:hypothetical protein
MCILGKRYICVLENEGNICILGNEGNTKRSCNSPQGGGELPAKTHFREAETTRYHPH